MRNEDVTGIHASWLHPFQADPKAKAAAAMS